MSGNARTISTAVILILLAIGASMAISISIIRAESRRQLERSAEGERERISSELKNQVDLVCSMVQQGYSQATQFSYQQQVYGRVLQGVLAVIMDDINRKIEQVSSGTMTLQEAQRRVISTIRQLRFGSEDDYVWIQTEDQPFPKMILHPLRPDLDGSVRDSPAFDCARNRADNLFVAAAEVASSGGGFLDYLWERHLPSGVRLPNLPKISYVQRVPQWKWVLGSGVFVDEAFRDAIARLKTQVGALRYDNGNGFFFVHDLRGSVLVHPSSDLVGRKSSDNPRATFLPGGLGIAGSAAGAGYFEFDLPGKKNGAETHLGYARLFEPLGWVIGTSCNIENLQKNLQWQDDESRKAIGKLFFWNILTLLFLVTITIRMMRITAASDIEASGMSEPPAAPIAEKSAEASSEPAEEKVVDAIEPSAQAVLEALRLAREISQDRSTDQLRVLNEIRTAIEKLADRRDPEGKEQPHHGKKS